MEKIAGRVQKLLGLVVLASVVVAVVIGISLGVDWIADHLPGVAQGLGIAVVAAILLRIVVTLIARATAKPVVLELDLTTMPDEAPSERLSLATITGPKQLTLRETVEALLKASADRHVKGVLVYALWSEAGLAQVQELRDALTDVRAAGKFAIAYSDDYSNTSYYLATACDEVLLQPVGNVGLTGFDVSVNFIKGALDKAGVDTQFEGRYEYKSAADQLTRARMSKPNREDVQRRLESGFEQVVAGVVAKLGRTDKQVRALIDRGPFLSAQAEKEGLVDALAYRDQAVERAKERAGSKAKLLDIAAYHRRVKRRPWPGKGRPATLAVITATGGIVSRQRGVNPLAGGSPMVADRVSEAFRKAVKDKRIKAVVLRVDSPGGSAIASETIWREVLNAKAKGKPVVVSMGNVAASGGYYISAGADRIVAQPGTITGSIGVISGKPILAKAKRKIGIHVEELKTSANAGLYSVNRPFSASEKVSFEAGLDDIYDTFTGRVADGRGLTQEQVHQVARGRVWTGADALERGLVDELGGLSTAVRLAKQVAGVAPDAKVKLVSFPKKQSALARLRTPKRESSDDLDTLLALAAVLAPHARDLTGLLASAESLDCGLTEADWLLR